MQAPAPRRETRVVGSEDVRRVVDLMFEANARGRDVARRFGKGSEEYALVLDEIKSLREIHREERLVRQPAVGGRPTPQPKRRPGWSRALRERSS